MSKLLTIKCNNPPCLNTFSLHLSVIGRKLYCSRQCRSEHHWATTPLFEKKCLNPNCSIFIKRKFKQQIEKIHYCSVKCRKEVRQQRFQHSLDDSIKSSCKSCGEVIFSKREPCGKLIPRKICDDCLRNQHQLKASKATQKVKSLYATDVLFRERRKEIYQETGQRMREHHKTFGLSPKWIDWYKNFSSIGRSKLEDKVVEFIKPKVSLIERSFPISNMFVDIYIPERNLVIECLGDYWHMNPDKYSSKDYNKSTKRTAQEQWNKDRRRRLFMESRGYTVVELWESEINHGDYKKLDIYIQ